MAPKNVTMIPATRNLHTRAPKDSTVKKRVAGYARVSTDSDEQFTSYEAQVDYYTKYIQRNPNWIFVDVYTDEGVSGTNTKKRDGFNQMIADALAGHIDLIVTKSVSRFARNTVDSLTTVRKLKERGVEVFFEKENIYTLDSKGELLITIMSSLAQEESRSISENVTWGRRKQFADGKVSLPYKRFLGYEKGPDGLPKIVPEQAKTVVYIFDLFMMGLTPGAIARCLTSEGIPTPGGKTVWQDSTIKSILSNEKYKGDALLQKEFTLDYLEKTKKINEGEVPQYYVRGSHPAIIDPEYFDKVQAEIERRKKVGRRYTGISFLSSRVVCGDCGGFFGPKVWNSNSKYRRVIWQCNNKFKGERCRTPHLDEKDIYRKFLQAYNLLLLNRDQLRRDCEEMLRFLTDNTNLEAELETLRNEQEVLAELTRKLVNENASTARRQADYYEKYTSLVDRYEELGEQIVVLEQKCSEREARTKEIQSFLQTVVSEKGELTQFDPRVWVEVVDQVTVYHDDRVVFRFKDGREIAT